MKKTQIAAILAALLLLVGCGRSAPAADQTAQTTAGRADPAETTAPAAEGTIYKNGSYEGIGYGNNGAIRVKIKLADDRIVGLEVVSQSETADIFGRAWDSISAAIMGQETPDLSEVDTVSGATNSSNGIIDAIKAALYKARR